MSPQGRKIERWSGDLTQIVNVQLFWLEIYRVSGPDAAAAAVLDEWRRAMHGESWSVTRPSGGAFLKPMTGGYADIPLGKPITAAPDAYAYMTRYFCGAPDSPLRLSVAHDSPNSYTPAGHLRFAHRSPKLGMKVGPTPAALKNAADLPPPIAMEMEFDLRDRHSHLVVAWAWGMVNGRTTGFACEQKRGSGAIAMLDGLLVQVARRYQVHVAKEVRMAAAAAEDVLTTRLLRAEWGPADLPGLAHLAALRLVMEATRSPGEPGESVDVSPERLGRLAGLRPGHARRLIAPHLQSVTLDGQPLLVGDWDGGTVTLNPALASILNRDMYREMVAFDWQLLRDLSKHALAFALPLLGIGQIVRETCDWTATGDQLRRLLHLPDSTPPKKVTVVLRRAMDEIQKALPFELDVSTRRSVSGLDYVLRARRTEMHRAEGLNRQRDVPARTGLPWEWHKGSAEAARRRKDAIAITKRTGVTAVERRDLTPSEIAKLDLKAKRRPQTLAIIEAIPGVAGVRILRHGPRLGIDVKLHEADLRFLKERRRPYFFRDDTSEKYGCNDRAWLSACLVRIVDSTADHPTPDDEVVPVNALLHQIDTAVEKPQARLHSTYLEWQWLLEYSRRDFGRIRARHAEPALPDQPVDERSPHRARLLPPPPEPPPAPQPDRTLVDMRLSGVALRARIVAGTTVVTAGDHSHCLGGDAEERLRKEPLGSLIDACAVIARKTDDDLVLRLLLFLRDPWMMADACAAGHVRMSRDVSLPVLFDDGGNMQIPLLLDDGSPAASEPIRLPVPETTASHPGGLPVLAHDHAVEDLAISA